MMKPEFNIYLDSIGLSGAPVGKVSEIYHIYNEVLGFNIEDIFISEYLNQDGSRIYENLWFFSKDYCFESKFFLTQYDMDSDEILNSIESFTLKKNDFDILNKVINDKSRLFINFVLKTNRQGEMKASKENCMKLMDIFLKYILPNFAKKH